MIDGRSAILREEAGETKRKQAEDCREFHERFAWVTFGENTKQISKGRESVNGTAAGGVSQP
jgi:hypothetical protein